MDDFVEWLYSLTYSREGPMFAKLEQKIVGDECSQLCAPGLNSEYLKHNTNRKGDTSKRQEYATVTSSAPS